MSGTNLPRYGHGYKPSVYDTYLPDAVDDSKDLTTNQFLLRTYYGSHVGRGSNKEFYDRRTPVLTASLSPGNVAPMAVRFEPTTDDSPQRNNQHLVFEGITKGGDFVYNPFGAEIGSTAEGGNNGIFTFSFWIRADQHTTTNNPNGYKNIFNSDYGGGVKIQIGQKPSVNYGDIAFQVHHGENQYKFISTSTNTGISSSTSWYHVVITYDGSSAGNTPVLYVNGSSKTWNTSPTTSGAFNGFISSGSNWIHPAIGNSANTSEQRHNGFHYSGYIADFAVWNEALTASEVGAIYRANASNIRATVPLGSSFHGNMDDLAVWTRELGSEDIKAIYAAHNGAYDPKSGFLNNPPRVMIRDADNHPGVYPTHIRLSLIHI